MAALDQYKIVTESVNVARATGNKVNIIPVRAYQFNRLVDQVSSIIDGGTTVTTLTTSGAGTIGGALAVTGKITGASNITAGAAIIQNRTLTAVNTTAAATLTVVKAGLVAGGFSSTSAAAVTVILDSVANIITSFAAAGITLTTGSTIPFVIDNSQGANTVTLQVDGGATIAVATPAITGGATLTVSTANKVGLFHLYLTSATTAILSRVI